MPSTITEPVGVRLKPADLDHIRKVAEANGTTRSALIAQLTLQGLRHMAAA
jgi:hypothetical protein